MTDAELACEAQAGKRDAYAELARRWVGKITALCHARVGRSDLADDLAQETLLRGFRSLQALADPERIGAWLCGIALRVSLDWLKAKQNRQIPFSALGPAHDPSQSMKTSRSSVEDVDQADEIRHLMAEVERLPDECRETLLLYYYQDLTYRELAQLLGVSAATINARLTRARTLLRARLGACRR